VGDSSETDREKDRYASVREHMVKKQLIRRKIANPYVLEAMRKVPRHLFVPSEYRHMAYEDGPLSIGSRQTISQPYVVALMTELLALNRSDRVLEIGVGSGYQTAILAELVEEVIGIERINVLVNQARERLTALGYKNVTVIEADGTLGYPAKGPYDGILVAAAAPSVPQPLIDQLAEGGRLVIPVGDSANQVIQRIRRKEDQILVEKLIPVRFVPLIGEHGFSDEAY
jgi:protein-L-isoaspartate(D-aspartate) O-methyltransferase